MEKLTRFGMKNSLTLPSLANKDFNSLRDESDEPVYTYNDEFLRHFVRKSIKGGRCSALNQYYKSNISQEVFNIISEELNVNGKDNVCEIINKYFEYANEQRKIIEDEYDSKFNDYRDNDEEERTEHINNQTYNQDGDESGILRIKYYNPRNLIFQHLAVKEKVKNDEVKNVEVKNVEVNRMRNGYIIDTLTAVDICESVKIGGKVIEIFEGVIYRENFQKSPFRKVIEKLFALRQKYKDEHNDLMQKLVKLIMNSLYGVQIRKDIDQSYKCNSQHWMETEYDENVLDYWKLPNGNYIVKLKKDDGLEEDNDIKNTLASPLGAFILSNSKRIMNNFIREINGFYNISIYYGDTDSLYIGKNYWDVLDKANLVGKNLCQGKNDYKTGGIFYGLFLAPKKNIA